MATPLSTRKCPFHPGRCWSLDVLCLCASNQSLQATHWLRSRPIGRSEHVPPFSSLACAFSGIPDWRRRAADVASGWWLWRGGAVAKRPPWRRMVPAAGLQLLSPLGAPSVSPSGQGRGGEDQPSGYTTCPRVPAWALPGPPSSASTSPAAL